MASILHAINKNDGENNENRPKRNREKVQKAYILLDRVRSVVR